MMILTVIVYLIVLQLDYCFTIIANIVLIFIIAAVLLKSGFNKESCNNNND